MNAIVAVDANWAIGSQGGLLFSLPTDMKRFRSLTLHGTVLMGRKTLDSFPSGRPLPKRRNLVVTRQPGFVREGAECFSSPEAALAAAGDAEPLWLIGGGSLYAALLSQCERVYLTKADAAAPYADTYFPNLDNLPEWTLEQVSEPITENGVTYRFLDYRNTRFPT